MVHFTLALAGKTVGVTAFFESTKEYCREYLCEKKADFSVSVTLEDIQREKEFFGKNAQQSALEPIALHRKIATKMLEFNIFLLHGSAVAVDGECFVFIAPSGTGKSTHTSFWRQKFGERAVMINDDKPFLKISQKGVTACGSPWSGKHGLDTNISVPLKGICILYRGAENVIKRITSKDAANMLHHQCYAAETETGREKTVLLLEKLMESVPLWKMHCTKTADAAITAFQAMSANISD